MSFFNQPFDARGVDPAQMMAKHPLGQFKAFVANTKVEPKGNNVAFVVTFKTEAGEINNIYNLEHENQQTSEIAQRQLSALCHATGVYVLDWSTHAANLRNAQLQIVVTATESKKNGEAVTYHNVSKVLDINGQEPRRQSGGTASPGPANAPQMPPQMQQPPQQGWAQPPQQPPQGQPGLGWQQPTTNANPPPAQGWQQNNQIPPNQAGTGNLNPPQNGGWQQGQASPNPPWKA